MFLKSAIYSGKSIRDDNALQYGAAMSTLAINRLKEVLRSVVPSYKITIPGTVAVPPIQSQQAAPFQQHAFRMNHTRAVRLAA
jgi:hypothetical protein